MEVENEIMNSLEFQSIADILEIDPMQIENQSNRRNFMRYKQTNHPMVKMVPTATSFQQVVDKAISGDHVLYEKYGLPLIKQFNDARGVNEPEQRIVQKRRQRVRSNFGNELDIHKVYSGQLDKAWDSTVIIEQDKEHKFVTLIADIGQNWDVDGLHSLWTMVVLLKLADQIEMLGKNVQIIVAATAAQCVNQKRFTTCSAIIKRYNERLAPERLCAMSHLGFFRTFFFAGLNTSKYQCREGLGQHRDLENKILPITLQKEISEGHTKAVIIKGALNRHHAECRIVQAYKELDYKL